MCIKKLIQACVCVYVCMYMCAVVRPHVSEGPLHVERCEAAACTSNSTNNDCLDDS